TFQLSGVSLATVSGLGPDLSSDAFLFKLLSPSDPSLSAQPKSRRTLLALVAGNHVWKLKPAVVDLPIGTLAPADGLFERILLETGESATGDTARVLAAMSSRSDGLALQVAGDMLDLDGKPIALALVRPEYVIA